MLRGCDIGVVRDRTTILDAVSLTVAPGEVVAVLGPNGAGKSTLLSVLSGSCPPSAGQALLDDRPLSTWSPPTLARKRAVLPQHSELAFSFRVLKVVLLGRSPHACTSGRHTDLRVAKAALAAADSGHLADRIYTTLSGGERQRVQLARILAQIDFAENAEHKGASSGRYLLLDEPTSSLDLAHQHATLKTARLAAEQGIGVLTVLHDMNLAAMYADRIVVLHDGRVVADGAPAEVLTESMIRNAFGLAVDVARHPTRNCPHVFVV